MKSLIQSSGLSIRNICQVTVASLLLIAMQAFAHHSFAMFDSTKLVVVKGTVLSFSYINPHSWLSVMKAENGAQERWDVEMVSPSALTTMGIDATTVKVGDKVTVGIRPLRDGRKGGSMVFLVTSDGKVRGADPSKLGLDMTHLKPE